MKKYFIITVDTEGDNLWDWVPGTLIDTKNANYIERFQELCNKYGMKPVYLSNFEMLSSPDFINIANYYSERNECEIGLHLHAWNNPPLYEIERKYDQPSYLIEYPENIMREKFKVLYDLYLTAFNRKPKSHRSGRWAMNEQYFKILKDFGIKVDCSVTPHIDWSKNVGAMQGGSDYSDFDEDASYIGGILEVPMTIRKIRWSTCGSWKHRLKALVKGSYVWLRPASTMLEDMLRILKIESLTQSDYVEFMVHSSELMPGGSPYYPNEKSIEILYKDMEEVFKEAKRLGFEGITLDKYYELKK